MTYESYILELLIDTGISCVWSNLRIVLKQQASSHACEFQLEPMTSVEENRDDER